MRKVVLQSKMNLDMLTATQRHLCPYAYTTDNEASITEALKQQKKDIHSIYHLYGYNAFPCWLWSLHGNWGHVLMISVCVI
jgi:hypothetical protein